MRRSHLRKLVERIERLISCVLLTLEWRAIRREEEEEGGEVEMELVMVERRDWGGLEEVAFATEIPSTPLEFEFDSVVGLALRLDDEVEAMEGIEERDGEGARMEGLGVMSAPSFSCMDPDLCSGDGRVFF